MDTRYVIVGGGGHALSVAEAALANQLPLLGYTSPKNQGELAPGVCWLGADEALHALDAANLRLLNGLGSAGHGMALRRDTYLGLRDSGFGFAELRHPAASVSPLLSHIGPACQVLAGAVLNAKVCAGENVLINSGAVIEHGCTIGSHCHIASGAVLCGDVELGDSVHIGAGATVIQGIRIGSGAVIAAGAVVTKNVEPLTLITGVPGRAKRTLEA